VAILDADKEGYLRSTTSLIQTVGRAARHADGHVIMYADRITDSMKVAISETNRRRDLQDDFNHENGIEPQSIQKAVHDITEAIKFGGDSKPQYVSVREQMSSDDMFRVVKDLEVQMKDSARNLEFEKAAAIRDEMLDLRRILALEQKTL
jgi:excinuclease ABC subunit B